jgi:ectoine hydroxylase-related dioxygenase (phytanoyl-CoA dioxygenase family)
MTYDKTLSQPISPPPTKQELEESYISYVKHKSTRTVDGLKKIVRNHFSGDPQKYIDIGTQKYRELVYEVQEAMSKSDYSRKITNEILPQINEYLNGDEFLIQNKLYLRAPRPFVEQEDEIVSWHRESFYGANLERSVVVWTPIDGVELNNTLSFIPKSQKIPDEELVVKNVDDKFSKKGSVSHLTGQPYSPKKIFKGVDLENNRRMLVPDYSSSLFSSDLIHGSGHNRSQIIRFATDYIIFPKKHWKPSFNKDPLFNSGKPGFEAF